jgi:hypothetical protein
MAFSSCGRSGFVLTKSFSYPSTSKTYEGNWEFLGEIRMITHGGAFTKESNKEITVFVFNKNRDTLLHDDFVIVAGDLEPTIEWSMFDTLKISWSFPKQPTRIDSTMTYFFHSAEKKFKKQ